MQIPGHPIECVHAREAASLRLDEALTELDEARLAAHLGTCPECRAYAAELAAIASALRVAVPAEPGIPLFMPQRRRPPIRIQTASAAVLLLALATGSSFALGRVLGGGGPAPATPAGAQATLSVRADSTRQHLLAMLSRSRPVSTLNVGRAVPL